MPYKNKDKVREYKKVYYLKNKAKILAKQALYESVNRDKIRDRHKLWYQENKQEINRKAMEYRSSDKTRKLRYNVSALVREKLKRRILKKNGKSGFSFLPYTLEDLMKNLERQFKEGMTWGNYGEWHIDHKIPDCRFDYKSTTDVNFQRSWSLENLQPLWAAENWRKNRFINN